MAFQDLFRPKWRHSDDRVRRAAVRQLTDQALLVRIARTDHTISVRQAAIDALTDQNLVVELATDESSSDVREIAVKRVTDQALVAKIATTDPQEHVRSAAAQVLNDQALLGRIATSDKAFAPRYEAAKRLTDEAVLIRIANSDETLRETALKKITDQGVLAEYAKNDLRASVRYTALCRLDDFIAWRESPDADDGQLGRLIELSGFPHWWWSLERWDLLLILTSETNYSGEACPYYNFGVCTFRLKTKGDKTQKPEKCTLKVGIRSHEKECHVWRMCPK